MIAKASQRGGGQYPAMHLLNELENDRVSVLDVRGAVALGLHDINDFKGAKHPGYFERMKFFDLLNQQSPVSPGVRHDPSGRFIPLKVFDSLEEVDDLKKQAEALLGVDRFIAPFVTRVLEEAMRNAVQHAGASLRVVVVQRYPGPQARIQLATADSGMGIRASLFNLKIPR